MSIANQRPDVLAALEGHSDLVELLGGRRVYWLKAPKADEFPRITFFEMTNLNDLYAEGEPVAAEIRFQIDVWTKGNFTGIVEQVDAAMIVAGFRRFATSPDLADEDGVFHKALRYIKSVYLREEN
ncbi:DUF3168 domain-containing protein [Tumebacillus sp. DT12]|uniref:DUF3168 domain-containing protein n=1 Tax=Tumebacillus lacus TaxID=2995335 RepID=A0ABT3X0H5_9BACL|nr:DUF3168 domain-containing protein [Tumebacillus lacus]MCX7570410.1 DUF3168 domain-containing protein [Tumebacillus lacus]